MKNLNKFKSEMSICDIHQSRIQMAIGHIGPLFPLTILKLETLSDEEISFLEVMISRFGKLQDAIGNKIFPLTLLALKEEIAGKSFLDRLNKLEKLGIIESVEFWDGLRETHNLIAHDYPDDPDLMLSHLNKCYNECRVLVSFWENLKDYIENTIFPKNE